MSWYVDSTVAIALGRVSALDLLSTLDGEPVVLPAVRAEVDDDPAATNLDRCCDRAGMGGEHPSDLAVAEALDVLGDEEPTGDAAIVAVVLEAADPASIGVVSDDRRVRQTARGLGATVTGTYGVVGRVVAAGELSVHDVKDLVRRIERGGFHSTGALRERVFELIEEAATE